MSSPTTVDALLLAKSALLTLRKRPLVPVIEAATVVAPFALESTWKALGPTYQRQVEEAVSTYEREQGQSLDGYLLPSELPTGIPQSASPVEYSMLQQASLSELPNWSMLPKYIVGTNLLRPSEVLLNELRFILARFPGAPLELALLRSIWAAGWIPMWEATNGDTALHAQNVVLRLATWGVSLEQREACVLQLKHLAPTAVVFCSKQGNAFSCAAVPLLPEASLR